MDVKLPYKFFIDSDPIAYAGASSAEPAIYYWVQKDAEGNEIDRSEDFRKAVDAKQWIEAQCWDTDPSSIGWERISGKDDRGVQAAYDATDEVVKDYLRTSKKFCREGKEPVIKGYLTESDVRKTKDIEGLEDRYQGNRTGEKPKYLKECRQYLLDTYPWVKMAKTGWEADTHVVGLAESAGEDGCTMSIDKDIDQVSGCHHINMNETPSERKCYFSSGIGSLWVEETHRGKGKIKGNGFKFLCYQAVVGDVSDGYKGLQGIGEQKAFSALVGQETKEACVAAIKALYEAKSKKGYICKKMKERETPPEAEAGIFKYESWDGVDYSLTIEQMMQQHFDLAYQERSPSDKFVLQDYL